MLDPVDFRNASSGTAALWCANHGSISDSWPKAFFGCPRGHRVNNETSVSQTWEPTYGLDTRPRTRALGESTGQQQACSWKMLSAPRHALKRIAVSSGLDRSALLSSKSLTQSPLTYGPTSSVPSPASCRQPLNSDRTQRRHRARPAWLRS